jgi:ATP-dependent exoDNAse (exonuclease V) alpha subunit
MINELDSIVLKENINKHNLVKGDIGTVVLVHDNEEGYEVEFITLDGETFAVTTLFPSQIRKIHEMEIANARSLELLAA